MKKWLFNHTGDILILLFVVVILSACVYMGISDRTREEQEQQAKTQETLKK